MDDKSNTEILSPKYVHKGNNGSSSQYLLGKTKKKRNCCELMQKNRRQITSLTPGLLLMVVSGMHIGWNIWNIGIFWGSEVTGFLDGKQILATWYIMAIFGSIIGSIDLVNAFRRKTIYLISACILILSSTILYIWPNKMEATVIARLIAGLGHGLVYGTLITHAAENAANGFRGRLLSSVNFFIVLGIFIFSLCHLTINYHNYFYMELLIGIIAFKISAIALMTTVFYAQDTVPYLLNAGREKEALEYMMYLRSVSTASIKVHQDFHEIKTMMGQEVDETANIFSDGNGRPLLLMTGVRVLGFFTNNWVLNGIQMFMMVKFISPSMSYHVAPILLIGVRLVAAVGPLCFNDSVRRKQQLLISGSMITIILLIIAFLSRIYHFRGPMEWKSGILLEVGVLLILLQVVASFGVDPLQNIFLAEAFSLTKKRWSITFVTTIENILHIVTLVMAQYYFFDKIEYMDDEFNHFIISGPALVIFQLTIMLCYAVPESVSLSLGNARNVFNVAKPRPNVDVKDVIFHL